MHPALFLVGISEPEKTSYKSPWGFHGEGNEPKVVVAQAEMGGKALGLLCLPLGGVYLGTNKEEKAFAWLSRARKHLRRAVSQPKLGMFQHDICNGTAF